MIENWMIAMEFEFGKADSFLVFREMCGTEGLLTDLTR